MTLSPQPPLNATNTTDTTNAMVSEADALHRWVISADRDALELALRPHLDAGWRVARRLCDSQSDGEDAVQEACLLAMRHAHTYRQEGSVRAWFLGIVAHTALARRRAEQRRTRHLSQLGPSGRSSDPVQQNALAVVTDAEPDDAGADERAQTALLALERLPEHERLPLWLHAVEGMTYREIALALARREGTVRSQVARGLKRLRDLLGARRLEGGAVADDQELTTRLSLGTAQVASPGMVVACSLLWHTAPVVPAASLAGMAKWYLHGKSQMVLIAGVLGICILAGFSHLWLTRARSAVSAQAVSLASGVGTVPAGHPLPALLMASRVHVIGMEPFTSAEDLERTALSPDGRTAVAGGRNAVEWWDLDSARRTATSPLPLAFQTAHFSDLLFTPDGTRLIGIVVSPPSVQPYDEVLIWDAQTQQQTGGFPIGYANASAAISRDGTTLVIPGGDPGQGVQAWDLSSGQRVADIQHVAHSGADALHGLISVALSRDGTRAVCLGHWGLVQGRPELDAYLLAWPSGTLLASWALPAGIQSGFPELTFTADGHQVMVTGGDSSAGEPETFLLDLPGGTLRRQWPGQGCLIAGSPGVRDDTLVLASSGQAQVIRLDGTPVGAAIPLHDLSTFFWHSRASADGRIVMMDSLLAAPLLIDLGQRRQRTSGFSTVLQRQCPVRYLPDGRLGVYDSSVVHCYDADTAAAAGAIATSWAKAPAFAQGRLMLAASQEGQVPILWDLAMGAAVARLPSQELIASLWLSADGTSALTEGYYDHVIRIHDLVRHTVLAELPRFDIPPTPLTGVRWSSDGQRLYIAELASGDDAPGATPRSYTGIRDARSGRLLKVLCDDQGREIAAAMDLDLSEPADLLALRSPRGVGLWRASDGAFLRRVQDPVLDPGQPGEACPLSFNYDATLLVGADRVARVLDGRIITRFDQDQSTSAHAIGSPAAGFGDSRHQLRAISPTGTLQMAVAEDGTITVRDCRSGGVVLRRTWRAEGAGIHPNCVVWRPGELGIAIRFSDLPVVEMMDVAGPGQSPATDATPSDADRSAAIGRAGVDLGSADPDVRSTAIATLIGAGRDGLSMVRSHLEWDHAIPDSTTRAAITVLDGMAQAQIDEAAQSLLAGSRADDPLVAAWCRDALARIAAGARARELHAELRAPRPFVWKTANEG